MNRRTYVLDVWLPDNGSWLALASLLIGAETYPPAPGFLSSAFACLGASVFWFPACLVLVGVFRPDWSEPPRGYVPPLPPDAEPPLWGEVVPLRQPPGRGLH